MNCMEACSQHWIKFLTFYLTILTFSHEFTSRSSETFSSEFLNLKFWLFVITACYKLAILRNKVRIVRSKLVSLRKYQCFFLSEIDYLTPTIIVHISQFWEKKKMNCEFISYIFWLFISCNCEFISRSSHLISQNCEVFCLSKKWGTIAREGGDPEL